MSAVPRSMREGSYALGANRMQTTVRVVFPAALSGIVAAVVLSSPACSRLPVRLASLPSPSIHLGLRFCTGTIVALYLSRFR